MQIRATMGYIFTPSKMAYKNFLMEYNKCQQDVEKL